MADEHAGDVRIPDEITAVALYSDQLIGALVRNAVNRDHDLIAVVERELVGRHNSVWGYASRLTLLVPDS